MQLFTKISSILEQPITQFVTDGVARLSNTLSTPLRIALILYIVIYGILIIQGLVREPIVDFAVRGMKLAIIVALVTNAATYNKFLTDVFFTTLPTQLGNAIAGSGNGAALGATSFDTFIGKGWDAAVLIWEESGWINPGPAALGAAVLGIAGVGTVCAYGTYIYAKIALAIVLAIGPIFVALALFQPTRRFTESWLGALANYVTLQVLVVTVLTLVINMLDTFAKQYADGDKDKTIIMGATYIVIFLLVWWISKQLPVIAQSIAGGGAALVGPSFQPAAPTPATAARAMATKGADGMAAASAARARNLSQAAANAGSRR